MTSPKFVDGSRPVPHPSVDSATIDEHTLSAAILETRTATLHRPNPSASYVWAMCQSSMTVAEMVAELIEVFGLDEDTARSGVEAALEAFWSAGLLSGSPAVARAALAGTAGVRILPREPDP